MRALEAIAAQAGHKPRFLSLDITAEGLTAEIQDPADPSRVVTWRVSQPGMLRSLLGTTAVRGRSAEPTLVAGSLAENLFDLDPAELARLPQLAEAALARARLQEPGAVVRMELRRQLQILPTTGGGPPRWEIKVKGKGEQAEIYADFSGKITLADLRETLRFPTPRSACRRPGSRRAGKADRRRHQGSVGGQVCGSGNQVDEFEASLATAPGAQPVTRFTAGFDGIHTTTFDVPRLSLPGSEPSDISASRTSIGSACPSCRNALATASASPTERSSRSSC